VPQESPQCRAKGAPEDVGEKLTRCLLGVVPMRYRALVAGVNVDVLNCVGCGENRGVKSIWIGTDWLFCYGQGLGGIASAVEVEGECKARRGNQWTPH